MVFWYCGFMVAPQHHETIKPQHQNDVHQPIIRSTRRHRRFDD